MKATATQSNNYPQVVIAEMVSRYEAAPTRVTVNELAAEFEKSERSVLLSSLLLVCTLPSLRLLSVLHRFARLTLLLTSNQRLV